MKEQTLTALKRISWIDCARAWGILFVVIGHMGIRMISAELYSFHLPLFFFLSGFLFTVGKKGFPDFLRKNALGLLVPYAFMALILSVYQAAESGEKFLSALPDTLLKYLIQNRESTLWFLTALFVLRLVFFALVKLSRNNFAIIGAVSVSLTVLTLVYYRYGGKALPWNIDICGTAIFFFALGYLFKNCERAKDFFISSKRAKSFLIFGCALALNLALTVGARMIKLTGGGISVIDALTSSTQTFNFFSNTYFFPPFTFLAAIAGIICVVEIANMFPLRPLRYIGAHTMICFGLHQAIFIAVGNKIFKSLVSSGDGLVLDLARDGFVIVFVFVCSYLIDFALRKCRLGILTGSK